MTTIYYEKDADLAALTGARVAVVGYGNQGRSWALNLRDSGIDVQVCARADESRQQALADGFAAADVASASEADILCILVPDDVIPSLPLTPSEGALTILASGYNYAFDRFSPAGDQAVLAPRMLGPEVRLCYQEGTGFITALGVHRDVTGTAQQRTLAIARAIGGLKQGAIEMTARQEAILDLAVEQALSPALTHVNTAFVATMLDHGIPLEAVITELVLSGEVERTYRLLREQGFARQMEYHSPTSQYGQLSRRGAYDHLDVLARMRELVDDIASGKFAGEWDRERDSGHRRLAELKDQHCGAAVRDFEDELRLRLGPRATTRSS
jgi:ketol-acid reductoisomerase